MNPTNDMQAARAPIVLAHAAYRLADALAARGAGLACREVRSAAELEAAVPEAEVLVVSGLWRNELLERAPRLRYVQSVSAGTDQYDRAAFRERGVRLASAQGVNERAVAQHAMALVLALARQLHLARDRQHDRAWRGMIGDSALREQELTGRTLVIVGLGRIGSRLAQLARAFEMKVIGVKRDPATAGDAADRVVAQAELLAVLPQADFVALTCPLTPETQGLIGAPALAAMKRMAVLVNVARGRVVDEPALVRALEERRIAGAALDCFWEEPLPATSPLWARPQVMITPHSAGETRDYESGVIDLLLENLERLRRGESTLRNQVV
jgi:phosphoglycerate dehydrogenase-like enzyme